MNIRKLESLFKVFLPVFKAALGTAKEFEDVRLLQCSGVRFELLEQGCLDMVSATQ
jgi:hypothetical protein